MPTTYPLDLTGGALTNQIANELHTFASSADRIFPLSAGPFYTIGLTVRHGVTNELLQPVTQYKALQLHRDASLISGKEVCAVIIVEDATVPSVRISYQCVGGIYSGEASLIQDLIANNPLPLGPVVWGQIIGIPVQFPPTEHLHHIDNIYGAEELVAVLERMRIAIAAGDSPAIAAIYQYIHTLLTNLNFQTEQQVIDLIGDTTVQYVKTYDSYAQLRSETHVINNESYLYIASGKSARNDGKGQIFMWDITCTTADDNDIVLRPAHILETDPGRFVAVLMLERKMKLLAGTVGRGFDTNGVLQDNLSVVSRVYSQNLNALMTPGPWFFTNDTLNKPPYVREGFVTVSRAFGLVHQVVEATYMDLDSTPATEYAPRTVRFTRHASEAVFGSGNFTWSEWNNGMDLLDMRRHGISSGIGVYNTLAAATDADTVQHPGKYFTTDTTTNIPAPWGILEVELINGDMDTAAEIEQTFKQSLGTDAMDSGSNAIIATRRRFYNGTTHVWTPWRYQAGRNGDSAHVYRVATPAPGSEIGTHAVNIAMQNVAFGILWGVLHRYGIELPIANNSTYASGTDLDTILLPGKYWITTGHAHSPFNYGILEVDLVGGTLAAPGEVHQRQYWDNREAIRSRDYSGVWTGWTFVKSKDLGYDRNLNNTSENLDNVIEPDDYWYGPSNTNAPTASGLLKVRRSDVFSVYQEAHGSNNVLYTRRRDYLGIWSPWSSLLSTADQRTEVFEIHIGGYTTGSGTRTYAYTVTPNDISFEIRLVSAGGPGAGGGGAANNSNEDYGGGGGGGGSSGAMALIQMVGVLPGSTINVSLGQPGAAGGISGTYGVSGTNSDSTYLTVYEPGGYGTTFAIELQGGRGGAYGWAGGINSSTAGGGGAQVTANVSIEGFYNYRVLLGEAGGGGLTAGWQGGSGGYGGAISQQCSGSSRTSGGAGSGSGDGSPGFDGLTPTSPPYQFGRGGGGGGGGRNGSSVGGVGGAAGVAGCIIRVTRNKV